MLRSIMLAGILMGATGAAMFTRPPVEAQRLNVQWDFVLNAPDGGVKWADADKGSVKGKLTFSRRRPKAPIVVYLIRVDDEDKTAKQGTFTVPDALTINQKGAKFDPGFAGIVRGQKINFTNNEAKDISHNVYFLGATEADLGISDKGATVTHTFKKSGSVSVHCSIHKNMDAKIFVAPNPAFDVVGDEETAFEIKGVPVGRYKLVTWQKRKRFKDASIIVEVKKDKATDTTVEMTR